MRTRRRKPQASAGRRRRSREAILARKGLDDGITDGAARRTCGFPVISTVFCIRQKSTHLRNARDRVEKRLLPVSETRRLIAVSIQPEVLAQQTNYLCNWRRVHARSNFPVKAPAFRLKRWRLGSRLSTEGARRLPHYFFFGPMLRMKTTTCHVSFSESVFL